VPAVLLVLAPHLEANACEHDHHAPAALAAEAAAASPTEKNKMMGEGFRVRRQDELERKDELDAYRHISGPTYVSLLEMSCRDIM